MLSQGRGVGRASRRAAETKEDVGEEEHITELGSSWTGRREQPEGQERHKNRRKLPMEVVSKKRPKHGDKVLAEKREELP